MSLIQTALLGSIFPMHFSVAMGDHKILEHIFKKHNIWITRRGLNLIWTQSIVYIWTVNYLT